MSDMGAIFETGGAAAAEFAAAKIAGREKTSICASCAEPLTGSYCAACGQPRDVHRRSIGGLLHDFISDIASFDSRILRTGRALILQPGELVRAYREGRTQPFVPPVRLYLFVSLLFFVTLSLTHIAMVQFEMSAIPAPVRVDAKGQAYMMARGERVSLPHRYADEKQHYTFNPTTTFFSRLGSRHSTITPDALRVLDIRTRIEGNDASVSWIQKKINNTMHSLAANPAALNGAITEWVPRVLFALLPLFALLLALFYVRRRQFYLVDHLVFSLNFHSFGFALLLVSALAAQVMPGGTLAWAVFGLMALYLLLAMRRVYQQGWIKTGVKFALVGTIYCLFFLMPAFAAILAFSVFGIGEGG